MLNPASAHESSASGSISMESLVETVPVSPWTIRPVRDGVMVGLGVLVLSWGGVVGMALAAQASLESQTRQELERAARMAASSVDPTLVTRIVAEGRLTLAEYDRMATSLAQCRTAGVSYRALSLDVLRDVGGTPAVAVAVEDRVTAAQVDQDGDGVLSGAELWRSPVSGDPHASSLEALQHDRSVTRLEQHRDANGVYFVVAYPIRQEGLVVGAVSVEVDATTALAHQNRLFLMAGGFLGANLLLAGVLGFLVYRTRRNERALAEQRHQVLKSLQRARDRALAGDKAKNSFLAMMSHELRTPLNGILGMAELLQMGDLDADSREMCGTIEGCGRNLLSLVNDLLDFSAIETGRIDFHPLPFDPVEPLQALLEAVTPVCESRGLSLILWADPDLPARVFGDADRVRQMLAPLVSNAVKFTVEGRIVLGVRPSGDGVLYEIRDTGPGIPEHLKQRLFQPFQQGEDYLRRQHGGTGLGLAITARLAEKMGANITVTVQGGSTFHVQVPLPVRTPARTWPAPGSRGTAMIRHADPEVARILALDVQTLGYLVVTEGVSDLLIVDRQVLETDGIPPTRLITQAGQVVVLMGLAAMVQESHRLADFGLIPLRKPCSRHQLAQALGRTSAGITTILKGRHA